MNNLWAKIKLIWKGREIATNLINIKSKWKSPAFWVTVLAQAGTVVGYLNGVLDPKVAVVINAVTTSLYNYFRGLQKAETDGVKPYATRSEFLLGMGSLVQSTFMSVQSQGIDPYWLSASIAVLGHSMSAAGELNNMRPKEVAAATGQTVKQVEAEASTSAK